MLRKVLYLFSSLSLVGCNPLFVGRAAFEEAKILFNRVPLEKVIASPQTPEEMRIKLTYVQEARAFALQEGLNTGEAFTTYSPWKGEAVTWVVVACKELSFEHYSWWFPIIGQVPYKGYFEKEDALLEAERLKKKGYEVSVRGAEAFSTLGWFNDPVLTPILRHSPLDLVNTVVHESVHSTVWIPHYVPFNESLANYIGLKETVKFFALRGDDVRRAQAEQLFQHELLLGTAVENLTNELQSIFQSGASIEEKRERKKEAFTRHLLPLAPSFPNLSLISTPNNAELLQLSIYMKNLTSFNEAFIASGENLQAFLEQMKELAQKVKKNPSLSPFDELLKKR